MTTTFPGLETVHIDTIILRIVADAGAWRNRHAAIDDHGPDSRVVVPPDGGLGDALLDLLVGWVSGNHFPVVF